MRLDLTIGTAGLTFGDIAPRLYEGTQRVSLAGSMAPIGDGTSYTATLDADAPGRQYTLTWEYPPGVGFSEAWGVSTSSPPAVIVPLREQGATLSSLGAVLFRDGVVATSLLRFLPLGSSGEPGDYALYGWPSTQEERWLLRWETEGLVGRRAWGGVTAPSGTRLDLEDRALAAFATAWRLRTPPAPLTTMPHVRAKGGGWRPANQEPFVELDILMDRGEESGPVGAKTYDLPGLIQVGVQVKDGEGTVMLKPLVLAAAEVLQGMTVQGLKCYGARKPYELPNPLAGYYGRAADVPARYVGP